MMGYETAVSIPTSNSRFGKPQSEFLFSSVNCKGDESSLFDCEYDYGIEMRAWSGRLLPCDEKAAGVYCLDNSTLTTELRGGAGDHEGNLYLNNLPVCHDRWGDEEAAVVCRMLGFRFGVPTTGSMFGGIDTYKQPIMNYVDCTGTEGTIYSCGYRGGGGCYDGADGGAGVICHDGPHDNGTESLDLELRDGVDESEGAIYINDRPLCADLAWRSNKWSMPAALVTCRTLGFQFGTPTQPSDLETPVTAEQFGYKVKCTGSEMSLDECGVYATAGYRCNTAVRVSCSNPVIELRGGTSLSGNIYIDNKHVCDWDWDNREARVACRMLGYSGGKAVTGSRFGLVNGTYFPTDLMCSGIENTLYDCKMWMWSPAYCDAEHAAGVECSY